MTSLSENGTKLIIIGDGSDRERLQLIAKDLGYSNQIDFLGEIHDSTTLEKVYASARMAIGPGYAGLNITQANCFGVPIIVDKFGKHAPEIVLDKFGGVIKSELTSTDDLQRSLKIFFEVLDWKIERRKELARQVSQVYCISIMAQAFGEEIRKQIEVENGLEKMISPLENWF